MLKLYGVDLSIPLIRVRLCLNALNIKYEYNQVSFIARENRTDAYLKLHPAGKVPVIDDAGFVLFESNAIMKYLCRKSNSKYYPNLIEEQASVDQWTDFVAHHVGSGIARVLFNKVFVVLFGGDKDERSMQDGYRFIAQFLPIIDAQLTESDYLACNEMTIADFCLLATLDPCELIEVDLSIYPHIHRWRMQLVKMPFYQDIHTAYPNTIEEVKQRIYGNE